MPQNASEALDVAFAHGATLQTQNPLDFAEFLSKYVNADYSRSPFLPFLRIGFTAGFFGLPKPNFERVAERCAVEDRRRSA